MPRAGIAEILARTRAILDPGDRFVDVAAQLRVWAKDENGEAQPAELLPRIYGGRYDRLTRRYVGPAREVREISCHAGQVPLLTFDEPGVARVLALGAPGGGKTSAIVRRAALNAIDRANSIGGVIAPTAKRLKIVWRDFLELAEPLGWVAEVKTVDGEIILANRTVVQFVAAQKPSAQVGTPIQGYSWDWAVVDESASVTGEAMTEIAARGRRAGSTYRIYEAATKANNPDFRLRLEQYKARPEKFRILSYSGDCNPWVESGWWENLRAQMSEREYREKILAEDVPPEMLVYPGFVLGKHVRPLPARRDITEDVTLERFGKRYRYVIGQDFGILVNASIVLRCFEGETVGERVWYAVDEITSINTRADFHARMLLSKYPADLSIVVADPHRNSKDTDVSDYTLFRKEGLHTVPASGGKIPKKHRLSMVNALLGDAAGRVRLHVLGDEGGHTECPELVKALLTSEYTANGEAEGDKKDLRNDRSHWPAALGYGLFPFERVRGGSLEHDEVGSAGPTELPSRWANRMRSRR